jgi:hypothetical protein
MMDDPLFDQLEAIHAYDTGSTDSGVHDEQLRARLVAELVELNPWENAEARRRLSVWVREAYLSEEAMVKGYGWEDALEFLTWIDTGEFRGR